MEIKCQECGEYYKDSFEQCPLCSPQVATQEESEFKYDLKYFSEDQDFVNAECEHCKRILKIKREQVTPNPTGFSLNSHGGVRCFCGSVHHNIVGTTQNISVSSGGEMADLKKPVKHSNYISGFLALCLFVVLPLFLIGHCMFKPAPPPSPEETAKSQKDRDAVEAVMYAKIYVQNSLKAPSTASFQNILDFAVAPAKDKKGKELKDVWEVSGYVDAQNSFGAMLRNKFYVKLVKMDDGKWIPTEIIVR
jgi:hypothetical protein